MIYHLSNAYLSVSVSDLGAELISVCEQNGIEYIWQGDKRFWEGHAPWLFPICGRLWEGHYTWKGSSYEMDIHGFARVEPFELVEQTDTTLVLTLTENERTLAQYPFPFRLTVTYTLTDRSLSAKAVVENTGEEVLPASFGYHPGFCVPLGEGRFEDYRLTFGTPCQPKKILLSPTCFVTPEREELPLSEGRSLPLRHELFANDAIFVENMASSVTLESDKSEKNVTICYNDAPYVGFWQAYGDDVPYVCVEPWYGLPSTDGRVDDFATKSDMLHLEAGEKKEFSFEMIFR